MTSPKVDNDLLIEEASRSWSPVDPDLAKRSLPAKSSRLTFPRMTVPCSRLVHSMLMLTIRCDRLLRSFMRVEPVWRELRPRWNKSDNWLALATGDIREPCTHTIPRLSFFISNFTWLFNHIIGNVLFKFSSKAGLPRLDRLSVGDRWVYRCKVPTLNKKLGHQIELGDRWLVGKFAETFEWPIRDGRRRL
jgi:hypothetical protein